MVVTRTRASKTYARSAEIQLLPRLIEVQLQSFKLFQNELLRELFEEISPIESFNGEMAIYFPGNYKQAREYGLTYWFEEPKVDLEECVERDLTYGAPLYAKVALHNRKTDEHKVDTIYFGEFPLMTENGTFIINGTERVVVSQLIRSPGVYFNAEDDVNSGRKLAQAKLIPDRGAWMEFETRKSDYLVLKFNRKRTIPVTILLRALAAVDDGVSSDVLKTGSEDEIRALFADVDTNKDHAYIDATFRQEPEWANRPSRTVAQEALIEFFRRVRPGDPPTLDNAKEFMQQQLFDQRRYDLERVGRYKLNKRLELDGIVPLTHRTVTKLDVIRLIKHLIRINNEELGPDDIDHLGNRRVKTNGELIQNKLRVGLRRMERMVKERMSMPDNDSPSPVNLINIRPVVAAVREFFGSSQLSQFMEQTNPLSELTSKRTLSALGPGGLRRERAGFDVRDVHHSHYGRICPIETPEGPNIGLIGRLATYAKVNAYGFLETPYRKVKREVDNKAEQSEGRTLREDVMDSKGDNVAQAGTVIDHELAVKLARYKSLEMLPVNPYIVAEAIYMSADTEDKFTIAQASAKTNAVAELTENRISVRRNQKFVFASPDQVDYVDIAPNQIVGISAALIPFLEHDDANRALMGSNMQRQAVPLLMPQVPIVGTGVERQAATESGQVILAAEDGEVTSVTGRSIALQTAKGKKVYNLRKYNRSNQSTCIDQRPTVQKGQRVKKGEVIADSSSTQNGELALGQNVLVAFVCWEGGNYEDAILVSERLVREDHFTSIHIEKHEIEARETKLGAEEITRDIPNVGEETLKDLDENGIIRIGAEVNQNDILVGKITPKGEKELSPEEKLLRAIFGEKSREVKDTSLRLPNGEHGKVVEVKVFDRDDHRDLPAGVNKMVRVSIAQRRKLTQGDKMAGRHGNKGVVSRVVPIEDMPYLADGTPVDIILNPTGVPGRMNLGQILETHLGWAADRLGFRAITPVFDGASEDELEAELCRAWLIDFAYRDVTNRAWTALGENNIDTETMRDDHDARMAFLSDWLADKSYDLEQAAIDEAYARRITLIEWLREKGFDPEALLVFEADKRSVADRMASDKAAVEACLRLWMEKHGHKVSANLGEQKLRDRAAEVSLETNDPLPTLGKLRLIDGKTGTSFDSPVTVGYLHMLKLAHLVEDKVHARSTGPYSLVTQQPLGGKAQFGGQRFGEMEVWALEAYGASHMLQEILTVKSDDVQGRVKTYESIVKGEMIEEPGIPASFKVLVKELQSLGLSVEAINEAGEITHFGKDDERRAPPKLGMGLMGIESGDRF
ncbi:MAG TPA: DNA-directed RNA polymerase subunit beta [Thermoflexales bacterium]|nr:DNA-directed RNA polymerase subunit beta [Thermoflexales bacterium]HRA54751.1 DNA-directed RNA polymerase subunit beta [Thermoflexales bacterium]